MTNTPIKEQVTLTFGSIEITGDLHFANYGDGQTAVYLDTDEGAEHISVNLAAHGLIPRPGSIFIKNEAEHAGLAQSMSGVGLGTVARTVTFGPFNSTAVEFAMEAQLGHVSHWTIDSGNERAEEPPEQYDWVGWEAEPEMTGDGSGDPEKHFLTIRDPGGEEYAVIVHRTVGGKCPLDGPLAEQKCVNAQNIVDALNAQERKA